MVYCLIKLLYSNINLSFTYHTEEAVSVGDIAQIELKNTNRYGIIIEIKSDKGNFETKSILSIIRLFGYYHSFIRFLAHYYIIKEELLYKKIIFNLIKIQNKTHNQSEKKTNFIKDLLLSKEQQNIYQKIMLTYQNTPKMPTVLHGMTGSGKTFLYIALILFFIKQKKSVILLVPNAHLSEIITNTITEYLGTELCYQYHSQITLKEKKRVWNAIVEKKVMLVCGVHLPLFLPISNLGAIIVDEEHDPGYVHQQYPYINTKEAALIRAKIESLFILLGSATPSIVSLYLVKMKKYAYFFLTQRYYETLLPKIELITLDKHQKISYLSEYTKEKIRENLQKKEQVLVYLNKKGLHRYAQCHACKKIYMCDNCSIVLTIFAHGLAECARCKHKVFISHRCKYCQEKNDIKTVGIGLDKMQSILEELFPQASIITLESKVLRRKEIAEDLLYKINHNLCDIILCTDAITKGYNFHKISLVVITNVDQNFFIPHFTVTEETIQTVVQVAGRGGRREGQAKVIVQSFNDMTQFKDYFEEKNYLSFAEYELSFRKLLLLPPYIKMALIIIKSDTEKGGEYTANKFYQELYSELRDLVNAEKIFITEPTPPLIKKIKKKYYQEIKIKTQKYEYITPSIKKIIDRRMTSKDCIYFIPFPILSSYE